MDSFKIMLNRIKPCQSFFTALLLVTGVAAAPAKATTLELNFTQVNNTQTIFRSDNLINLGFTEIGSITFQDDGVGSSAPGLFTGFDLDALVLDVDGNAETLDDQFFASNFIFSAGTTRPTTNTSALPTSEGGLQGRPGPTFGAFDASTVDLSTATLGTFDGVPGNTTADGFLSLGDNGTLIANFEPTVSTATLDSLFVLIGDVGITENIGASIFISDEPASVPEPLNGSHVALVGMGLLLMLRKLENP